MTHEPQRVPADIINGVLTKLVCDVLTLRPEHKARLAARGLGGAEIERLRYVSAPATRAEREQISDLLAPYLEAFGGAVPGFYRERGRWRMVYRPSGFFIPARDERGFIQALAQRVDEPKGGGKYIWVSSADSYGGAPSGAPIHFANRPLLWDAQELTVVEGTLKADCVAALAGLPVVGVAGVNNIRGLASRLRANLPRLRRVVVAFDKDVFTKPQVRAALERLISQLEGERFSVRVRTWLGDAKGFDDYLLSQLRAREVVAR
jgi:hypothetical protein